MKSFNLRVDESDIPTNLRIDLNHAINGTADNFTVKLMQLFFKADSTNFEILADCYPDVADVIRRYKRGEVKGITVEPQRADKLSFPHIMLRPPNVTSTY